MFTAKGFIRNSDYETLTENLLVDPDRLSLEFLEIATNPSEPYTHRLKALRVLHTHARDLDAADSPCIISGLMAAFEREFPMKTLSDIAKLEQSGCSHNDSLLLYRFGVTLARIAGESAQGPVEAVRQVFKETCRESSLNSILEMIQRQRQGYDS